MRLEGRGREVGGHDCEDEGDVGGAEGVDVGGGEIAGLENLATNE